MAISRAKMARNLVPGLEALFSAEYNKYELNTADGKGLWLSHDGTSWRMVDNPQFAAAQQIETTDAYFSSLEDCLTNNQRKE
tara:strand:+ start:3306 stop:3551 length:246 start_codon:yes stop_codon:yes gene_type:complete